MQSIGYCLANLTRFSGRDPRGIFWPYAGVLFAGLFAAFAFPLPGLAGEASTGGADLTQAVGIALWIGAVFILLSAAAIVRRLHDTGLPGWLALIPATLFVVVAIAMREVNLGSDEVSNLAIRKFFAVWAGAMVYNLTVVVLLVLLARTGSSAANKYGPPISG